MSTPNQPSTGYPQPSAQPPKKKSNAGKIIGLGCGIPAGLVIVIIVIVAAVAGTGNSPGGQPTAKSGDTGRASSSQPERAGTGDPVQVGDFEVTVTGVEDGVSQIGPDVLGQTADGQYVLVSVEVTNTSDKAAFFNSGIPKLLDGDGNQYSTAPVVPEEQGGELFGQVNPDNTTAGKIVFDIPKDIEPTGVEFSGGLLDGPMTVNLS